MVDFQYFRVKYCKHAFCPNLDLKLSRDFLEVNYFQINRVFIFVKISKDFRFSTRFIRILQKWNESLGLKIS